MDYFGVIVALGFIVKGLAILRRPEGRLFWIDKISLWFVERVYGPLVADATEQDLREVSRIRSVGWTYLIFGTAGLIACTAEIVYKLH